ncbi:cytochrome P450 [Podospora australis]|uniref:Cytochrome P450 n=1 Tax=Podospora australis TaxID=1536484 RepID=A0AAN6WLP3_9PEZI|nr:cytochrome P450 [Podospora australis]
MDARRAASTGLVVCLGAIAYLVAKGYRARLRFYQLRQQGMPMPPWNPILGHLLAVPPVIATLPEDTQQPDAFEALCRAHEKDDSIIYLDMWPFADPMMVVCSPVLAVQACGQELDLVKPPILHRFFAPLAGGDNLFTMNGPEWKRSRALFNAGFGASYIMQQTDHVVEETKIYVEVLREYAQKGKVFSLDEATCWYTMDIIGAVTLDSRLQSQRQNNPLATALRRQIDWHILDNEWNLLKRYNPARPFVHWYNGRQMDKYISAELDKRYAEWTKDEAAGSTTSRSVIHLALSSYMSQQKDQPRPEKLDPAFKRWATVQIRLFLFAGHDSTSSTICYAFYLLHSHPDALAKLRAEHDDIFGTDLTETADKICAQPNLVNQLPYTTAVIKESLRLFPPASAMRGGNPGVHLVDQKGNRYPTEGTNLWILHSAIQRNEKYWVDPLAFRPERWLVDPEDELFPSAKGAWRPFEYGPRNCLGQTLAMLDVKICLALTVREFDVKPAYDEWDAQNPTSKIKHVNGERAYQTQKGGAHPADGFPCRVTVRA